MDAKAFHIFSSNVPAAQTGIKSYMSLIWKSGEIFFIL